MTFRDDGEAGRARADALEQELARTRDELERVKRGPGPTDKPPALLARAAARGAAVVGVVLVAAAFVSGFVYSGSVGEQVGIVLGVVGVLALWFAAAATVMRRLLVVPAPHEAVVVSGRPRRAPDGSIVGYRVVVGRRVVLLPLVEHADLLDLRPQSLEISVTRVYLGGRELATVDVEAMIRISPDRPTLDNAVERFLGRPPAEILLVARQTLEGAVRVVAAGVDAERAATELGTLSERLKAEVEPDLTKLGFALDVLRVVRVSGV